MLTGDAQGIHCNSWACVYGSMKFAVAQHGETSLDEPACVVFFWYLMLYFFVWSLDLQRADFHKAFAVLHSSLTRHTPQAALIRVLIIFVAFVVCLGWVTKCSHNSRIHPPPRTADAA